MTVRTECPAADVKSRFRSARYAYESWAVRDSVWGAATTTWTVQFRRSFGPHKCCHPQISDLGFIISWWQLSCEIFLQILTSLELHLNSANRPGILLSHDGSLEVNLLMIFLELSLKKTSRMTKSDICGWQHLRVPKYLLDMKPRGRWLSR